MCTITKLLSNQTHAWERAHDRLGTSGNIREIGQLQRCENAACASGISTLLHAPPRSNYSPGAGKVQGACAAMPNSRHRSRSDKKSRKGRLEIYARLYRFKDRECGMRKWHPHFYTRPLAPITVLAQVKCREHVRPCQTRAISRSENKSKRSVGNIIYATLDNFKDV